MTLRTDLGYAVIILSGRPGAYTVAGDGGFTVHRTFAGAYVEYRRLVRIYRADMS